MLRFIAYMVELLTFLLAIAVVLNLPLLAVVLLLRRRLGQRVCALLLGAGFAAAAAYQIWRMEWFDVFRHGVPPPGYFVTAFFPYMTLFGAIGFYLGHAIAPRRSTASSS